MILSLKKRSYSEFLKHYVHKSNSKRLPVVPAFEGLDDLLDEEWVMPAEMQVHTSFYVLFKGFLLLLLLETLTYTNTSSNTNLLLSHVIKEWTLKNIDKVNKLNILNWVFYRFKWLWYSGFQKKNTFLDDLKVFSITNKKDINYPVYKIQKTNFKILSSINILKYKYLYRLKNKLNLQYFFLQSKLLPSYGFYYGFYGKNMDLLHLDLLKTRVDTFISNVTTIILHSNLFILNLNTITTYNYLLFYNINIYKKKKINFKFYLKLGIYLEKLLLYIYNVYSKKIVGFFNKYKLYQLVNKMSLLLVNDIKRNKLNIYLFFNIISKVINTYNLYIKLQFDTKHTYIQNKYMYTIYCHDVKQNIEFLFFKKKHSSSLINYCINLNNYTKFEFRKSADVPIFPKMVFNIIFMKDFSDIFYIFYKHSTIFCSFLVAKFLREITINKVKYIKTIGVRLVKKKKRLYRYYFDIHPTMSHLTSSKFQFLNSMPHPSVFVMDTMYLKYPAIYSFIYNKYNYRDLVITLWFLKTKYIVMLSKFLISSKYFLMLNMKALVISNIYKTNKKDIYNLLLTFLEQIYKNLIYKHLSNIINFFYIYLFKIKKKSTLSKFIYYQFKSTARHSFSLFFMKYYIFKFRSFFRLIELTLSRYSGKRCYFIPIYNLLDAYYINSAKMWCEFMLYELQKDLTLNHVFYLIRKKQIELKHIHDGVNSYGNRKLQNEYEFRNAIRGIRILFKGNLKKGKRKKKVSYFVYFKDIKYTGQMPLQKFAFYIDYYSLHVFLDRSAIGLKFWLLANISTIKKEWSDVEKKRFPKSTDVEVINNVINFYTKKPSAT